MFCQNKNGNAGRRPESWDVSIGAGLGDDGVEAEANRSLYFGYFGATLLVEGHHATGPTG